MAHFSQELQRSTQIINSFNATKDALKVADSALELSEGEIRGKALDRWANVGWIKDLDRFGGLAKILANQNSLFPGMFQPIRDAIFGLQGAIDKFNAPGAKPSTEDFGQTQGRLRQVPRSRAAKRREQSGPGRVYEEGAAWRRTLPSGSRPLAEGLQGDGSPRRLRPRRTKSAIENAMKAAEEAAKKAKESTDDAQTGAEGASKALTQVSEINHGRAARVRPSSWPTPCGAWQPPRRTSSRHRRRA